MEQMQNICFFNTTKFWGGGEKWHFEAAQLMTETANNTFFVVDGEGELAKRLLTYKIRQHHVSVNNRSFLNPIKVAQLVTFFKTNQINTVIFNSPKDLKLGGKAAKKAGVKNIVYRRGIAVEVKKKPLNEKLFKDTVTHFIFNSKATKELLEKNFKEVLATKKTAIIYNAIDFSLNTHSSTPNSILIIGNAGRLVEQKAQHVLIEIAEELKQKGVVFKIQIAGEGPLYSELTAQIKLKNLTEQIELLGFVVDMKTFMQKIDVFVSTALWEGFGFVLAEAMVYKKPVLAFNLSSNPELINDGENGFLIPPNDIKTFANKLGLLIKDAELRSQMGENAYLFAKTNFERQQQFQKLVDFIA
jgi:glycosyltransferase involved in cell wall biosynthesis